MLAGHWGRAGAGSAHGSPGVAEGTRTLCGEGTPAPWPLAGWRPAPCHWPPRWAGRQRGLTTIHEMKGC